MVLLRLATDVHEHFMAVVQPCSGGLLPEVAFSLAVVIFRHTGMDQMGAGQILNMLGYFMVGAAGESEHGFTQREKGKIVHGENSFNCITPVLPRLADPKGAIVRGLIRRIVGI